MHLDQSLSLLVEPLRGYVEEILGHNCRAQSERHDVLVAAAEFVMQKSSQGELAELSFICTHNSRRSHFAHVWANTAVSFYSLDAIRTYSGGTEATACNVRTIRALRRAGYSIVMTSSGTNPHYLVQAYEAIEPIEVYSKIYFEDGNPTSQYAAMLCCSDVDGKCPVIQGNAVRLALHYDDPKTADGTGDEVARYDERCLQIGRDMFQLMSIVQQGL